MNDDSDIPYPIEDHERYFIEPRSVYDLALIGYCEHTNRAVYSTELLIQCIINNALAEIERINEDEQDEIELNEATLYEEAQTFYNEQIVGVWLGDCTPVFVSTQKIHAH